MKKAAFVCLLAAWIGYLCWQITHTTKVDVPQPVLKQYEEQVILTINCKQYKPGLYTAHVQVDGANEFKDWMAFKLWCK